MATREELRVSALLVNFLLSCSGKKQEELGRAARVDQADISRYGLGQQKPREKTLRRMAEAAGVPWPVVLHLRRFYENVLAAAEHRSAFLELAETSRLGDAVLEAALLAVSPYVIEEIGRVPGQLSAEGARREAEQVWASLEGFPLPYRKHLLALAGRTAVRSYALAERVCDASERAAADDTARSMEVAEFALFIAQRIPGEPREHLRLQGYVEAFTANAWRVANEFDRADESFARARRLWEAGAEGPFPLAGWRLLDLEASLRRAQERFSDSLALLDRAADMVEERSPAAGRIVIKKSHVLEQLQDFGGALAALAAATPAIEASGDPQLLFALRFNTAANLVHLGRFAEAAALLWEVRALSVEQENQLSLIRVRWLEARAAAGLGRTVEAAAGLEQVQRDFTARELPYDAALSCLDLAVLWLEEGRTAEVRELAVGLGWIFQAKGVHTKALAALALFCEAAREDAVTIELARQVMRDVERARRAAPEKAWQAADSPGG